MSYWPKKEICFKRAWADRPPLTPWPPRFFVTERSVCEAGRREIEVRPITATAIFKAVATNFFTMNYWRVVRLLWRAGFLNTPEGEYPRWRHLAVRFWKYRIAKQ